MPEVHLPLSGNVAQTINPWNWFLGAPGSQVNVNLGKSSDPELEAQILSHVGSYGRQLGQIGDALLILLNHLKLEELNPEEQKAVQAFRYQLEQINYLKDKRQPAKIDAVIVE